METEFYRNFIAIVDSDGVTAAAKNTGISQPTLSNQLKVLQEHYKQKFIISKKGSAGIELTSAGQKLYRYAMQICHTENNLQQELKLNPKGVLKIGLNPSISEFIHAKYIFPFSQSYPEVKFSIIEDNTQILGAKLFNREIELVLTDIPIASTEFISTVSLDKQVYKLVTHKKQLPQQDLSIQGSIQELWDIPLVILENYATNFYDMCTRNKFSPQLIAMCSNKATALQWINSKPCGAILPMTLSEYLQGDYQFTEIKEFMEAPDISLSRLANSTASAQLSVFLDFLNL